MNRIGMKSHKEHITKKSFIISLFYTFVFNTVIAIFLTAIKINESFFINFIFSQCIGLCICTCVLAGLHVIKNSKPVFQAIMVAAALLIGTLIGSFIF